MTSERVGEANEWMNHILLEWVNIFDMSLSFIMYSIYQMWQWNKQQVKHKYTCGKLHWITSLTCVISFHTYMYTSIYMNVILQYQSFWYEKQSCDAFPVWAHLAGFGRIVQDVLLRMHQDAHAFTLVAKWGNYIISIIFIRENINPANPLELRLSSTNPLISIFLVRGCLKIS